MNLTRENIKHIAFLSKLEFSEEELKRFENEFNTILEYISHINECNVSDIPFEHNLIDYKGNVLQDDIARDGLSQEKALLNATSGRNKLGYIRVSKIIDK